MRITEFVRDALFEDLGRGDLFELISTTHDVEAKIIAKDSGVFSGELYARALCEISNIHLEFILDDSKSFANGDTLLKLSGSYTSVLKIERTLLNMLQHSSGIATNTNSYIQLLPKGCMVKILDTRKTRPFLREFEKYSVRNGGGSNHRMGLDDSLMLKDTHLAHIKDLEGFIKSARDTIPWTSKIEVEAQNIDECIKAMECGADIVMCDNMPPSEVSSVVLHRNANFSHILLEASGNINKENITEYAKTGVNAISIGSLIHQAKWLDMSMKMS